MNDRYRHTSRSRNPRAGKEGRRGKVPLTPWLRLSQQRLLRDPEAGASLAYALVIALVVLMSSLAVVSRTTFSTFGAVFQQDTRRAREAAEFGIQRTIAELNRERNRGLLRDNPDAGGFWSNAEALAAKNPCAALGGRVAIPNRSLVRSGGADAAINPDNPVTVYVNDNGTLTAEPDAQPDPVRTANVRYAYQIVPSVQVTPVPYTGANAGGVLNQPGTLTLRARGFSYNNGRLSGSTTVEEQIEVLPKCCGRSLAVFGNDLRSCTEGLGKGFGLLIGTSEDTVGDASLVGRRSELSADEEGLLTIDPVVCLGEGGSQCPSSVTVGSNQVDVLQVPKPTNFPDVDQFPTSPSPTFTNTPPTPGILQSCFSNPTGCSTSSAPIAGAFRNETGSGSNRKTILNVDTVDLTSGLPSYCKPNTDSDGVTTIHCYLDSLNISTTMEVHTSTTRRLRLYFASEGAKITSSGTSEFNHINQSSFGTQAERDAASVRQLQVFGCIEATGGGCFDNPNTTLDESAGSSNKQTVTLNGNSAAAVDPIFWYFPIGDITINGGGGAGTQLEGVIWTNELTGNGNVEIIVPGSGVIALLTDYGLIDPDDSGADTPPVWDFVARAVRQFRLLPGT